MNIIAFFATFDHFMDLVIPLLAHSDNDFLDLRYALRGFERFLPHDKVYLIGGKPSWIKKVQHIPAEDSPDTNLREKNIFDKLLLYPGDKFVYCGDDYYLLEPWTEEYLWDMLLANKLYSMSRFSTYQKTIANTLRVLPAGKNYDTHCPITMKRAPLHSLTRYNWHLPYGYCLQSLYARAAGVVGVQYPDMKMREPFTLEDLAGRKWFSTADGVVDKSRKVMEMLYPKKSKYE